MLHIAKGRVGRGGRGDLYIHTRWQQRSQHIHNIAMPNRGLEGSVDAEIEACIYIPLKFSVHSEGF